MNKFTISVISAAVAGYAGVTAASGFTGNVTFASDYVYRGISQTENKPAIQGSITYNHDAGFYVGAWGSNVDFNDGDRSSAEFDLYTGWSGKFPALQQMGWDLNVLYYAYPHQAAGSDYDYVEFTPALSYDFGTFNVNGKVSYSPDFFGTALEDAFYTQANVGIPLPNNFSLSGHLGYQTAEGNAPATDLKYLDWSLGVAVKVATIDLGLTLMDTDMKPGECGTPAGVDHLCDIRAVVTVGKTM